MVITFIIIVVNTIFYNNDFIISEKVSCRSTNNSICRLALAGLNQHTAAIENYKRAIELDPNNDNFKTNLEIAEEKAASANNTGLSVHRLHILYM